MTNNEANKVIGDMWKGLGRDECDVYEKQSLNDKLRYLKVRLCDYCYIPCIVLLLQYVL